MGPLTIAMAFSTIVGLLADFKSERQASSKNEYENFLEWLNSRRHQQIIDQINENNLLARSIRLLLSENHEQVIRKLESIDSVLINVASQIETLSDVAAAMAPNYRLSDQAVLVLRRIEESGTREVVLMRFSSGELRLVIPPNAKNAIAFSDQRFIKDDMNVLCDCSFLRLESSLEKNTTYSITRTGSQYIKDVDGAARAVQPNK